MKICEKILSYISGYIDGDGCFFIRKEIRKKSAKYPCQIIINSTNLKVLEFIQKNIGGTIRSEKNRLKFPKQKQIYRYCLCGKKSVVITELLVPFLIEKKDQALCYIDFFYSQTNESKDTFISKMKLLKNSNRVTSEHISHLKTIKNTKNIIDINFPYFAGFIDAECCFTISRYKSKNSSNLIYKLTICLTNTKIQPFIYLAERLGGSFSFISQKFNKNAQIFWRFSGKNMTYILSEIYPFIITKKAQCKEFINFQNIVLKNGGARHTNSFRESYASNLIEREQIFHKLKILNHRGN